LEDAGKGTDLQDARLVQRLQSGDMSALAGLVERYQDRVYNAVWRICGHVEDARDVTQEAFLRACESIGSFRGQAGFYTWIFRIAVNLALTHRRSMKRRPTMSLDALPAEGDSAASLAARVRERTPHDPEVEAGDTEIQGHVAAALHRLEDEFRAVIVLRDLEGFDYARIAEVLGIAPGTVKSRLYRARIALRKMLEPVLRPDG